MQPARHASTRLVVATFNSTLLLRVVLSAFFIFLACYVLLVTVNAGSGLVSSIGGVTFIQGTQQFWHTSARPTFSGVTTAGAAVSGTAGSQSVSATADGSGNWSWTPPADLSGDNATSITSGSTSAAFTLTIGALPESVASASAGTLAPAGSTGLTFAFIAGGILLLVLGSRGFARTFSKFN